MCSSSRRCSGSSTPWMRAGGIAAPAAASIRAQRSRSRASSATSSASLATAPHAQRHAGVGEQCLRPRPLLGRRRGALEARRQRDAAPTRPIDERQAHERDVAVTRGGLPAAGPAAPGPGPLPFAHDPLDRRIAPGASEMAGIARAEESVRRQSAVHEGGAEVAVDLAHPAEHDVAARVRGGSSSWSTSSSRPSSSSPALSPNGERSMISSRLTARSASRDPPAGRAWSRAAGRRRSSSCR